MIKVENLTFSHNGTTPVLSRIDFQAQPGEVLTVLGPNGSGKTTLFQCILGTWKPREGGVLLSGKSVGNLRRPEIARMVAVVPQDHDPPFPYSAFDVVLMGRTAHVGLFSSPAQPDRDVARNAMRTAGIEDLADRPYTRLSGGERQLVLLARCLAQQSPVMLLDEPTAHLDFRNQIMILSKVKELVKEKNLLSLMNLHDPNLALLFQTGCCFSTPAGWWPRKTRGSRDTGQPDGGLRAGGGIPGRQRDADDLPEVVSLKARIMPGLTTSTLKGNVP